MRRLANICCVLLALAGSAAAQITITDVVNAGNRFSVGFPAAGVAQGAVFAVIGNGVGTDPLQQAAFPLPTTDGLGGVTIQATVGGTTVDCIMVYISANEVGAILPSATPTGTGTVTVNNNGQTASAPITVVSAAFGTFTQNQTGSGPALAFNVNPDGSTTLNTLTQSAQTGQDVMLNGTGLGGITSDETASGDTDVPGGSAPIVWVGSQQATVTSYGRNNCCAGLDPNFKVLQGAAGWDVIRFTVPAVTGCHVPVAIQTGNLVSNFTTIAVSDGGTCTDPGGFTSDLLASLSGSEPVGIGYINLDRSSTKISMQGISIQSNGDSGSAHFYQLDPVQFQAAANPFNVSAFGTCIVALLKEAKGQPIITSNSVGMDAGNPLNVTGPKGVMQMTPTDTGVYSGDFGKSTVVSGLPPGIPLPPGLGGGGPPFLEPGHYTVDNGAGSSTGGVGAFSASLDIPPSLVWANEDQISNVSRASGVNVTWTGGSGVVNILGASQAQDSGVSFICTAQASAGQFAVPAVVTLSLPMSNPAGSGFLSVSNVVTNSFTAPGINYGEISSSVGALKNLSYQ